MEWRDIETAPQDGTLVLIYAPGRDGLPALICPCAWHEDAGFCVDELRSPTHWMPLPEPPTPTAENRQMRTGMSYQQIAQMLYPERKP